MDRIRWSGKAIPFRDLVDNPSIKKPTLTQINGKAVVVGEKINGEYIMASPCKVSGDRFDVMNQEIILSCKHSGIWRVISKATSIKEGHIHRLSTKDLERIHRQDVKNQRSTPRSYVCIRDVEAFELIVRNGDSKIVNGSYIERRVKPIEEDTEFEITDTGEVEYTPSEGERTSQDYAMVPKNKQGALLQLFLPGIVVQEQVVRNRVLRVLHCVTKCESRKRHFLLEVNEQPCEIRPIASEGSTELRYLHSTQNLYDYMLTYGNDTVLYVKLLRGDPPIKAIEFDGYMVLKNSLQGDKIPICRVEDLEVTLVSPDLPIKVRLTTKNEQHWRSLSEVRAAEVQCMQLALALLARHESEMYVTLDTNKDSPTNYHQERKDNRARILSDSSIRRHRDESDRNQVDLYNSTEKQMKHVSLNRISNRRSNHRETKDDNALKTTTRPDRHFASDRFYGTADELNDPYHTPQRLASRHTTISMSASNYYKTKSSFS